MSPHEENSVSDKSSIEESPARRLTKKLGQMLSIRT